MITNGREAAARPVLTTMVVWFIASGMCSSSRAAGRLFLQEAASDTVNGRAAVARIDGILQRARSFLEKGDLTDAKAVLNKGLETYAKDPGLHNFLGVVEAQQHDFNAAEADFKAAIRENPRYTGAYLNLGHLYLEYASKNPALQKKALETYSKMFGFDPENPEANYESAVVLSHEGNLGESLARLAKLPADERQRPIVLGLQLTDDAGLGRLPSARDALQKFLASPELTEAQALTILPSLEKSSHPNLGIQLLEGLESRGLASPSTLNRLAVLEENQGRLDRARLTLERIAAAEPGSVAPLVELARVANKQQDYRGALGYLAHARTLEPNNAGIHFFFGMMCVKLDLHEEAYVSLKKAVALNPNDPYYNYALGAVCTQRGDSHKEAIPYFKKYCALEPRDPRGELALGSAYYYSHDLDSARNELLKVVHDKVTAAGANYYLGRIANDMGKWPEAARYLQTAIRDYPEYADAYAALGSVYLSEKDYSDSANALLHALRIEPDNYLANLNLTILYERRKDARAAAQARRFATVKTEREQRAKLFLRTIRVVP